ncbi:AraC family transcriptional regulator protein (plasmid) [Rhizobium etli bv. mimosae str. IE4771]|uniref:AraC family transcriptional regulator protein n=1 Tax=Rhizobium etli bv. mimosae str. IE4771 TaxID=1432050 RepID=A0A060I9Q3_RHIET|nr:AraC family transcriptional regulator protein [Rhizobium sp. IE4771]
MPARSQVLPWPLKHREPSVNRPLLDAVTAYIEKQGGGQGLFPTAIEGFNIVRSFQSMMPMRNIYRPSLCVVLEGGKELHLGEQRLNYRTMECLVVSVGVPATGQIIEASEAAPYVGVMIDFDVATLREVLEQLDSPPAQAEASGPCAFVAKVDQPLADCILRLVRMLATPKAIPVLAPSIVREICFWLLSGPHGGELCKLALPESNIERVVRAVSMLHTNFADTLRVEQLAEIARMSPSSFHQHFKALTAMTPLQFQKQLRLLEARRLMVTQAVNVAEAAYRVGYESASQFSREYSRTFGIAPKQDALNQQRLHNAYASRTVPSAS